MSKPGQHKTLAAAVESQRMRRAQHRAPCCRLPVAALIFTIVLVLLLSAVLASLAADGPNHVTLYLPGLLVVLLLAPPIICWIREEDASFQFRPVVPTSTPRAPPSRFS